MRRRAAGLALAVTFGLVGCKQNTERQPSQSAASSSAQACAEPALRLDDARMAWLSKARAVHLQADLAESDGNEAEAAVLLNAFVKAPPPGGESPPPEEREVLADTFARLADLDGRGGKFASAREFVRQGLDLAKERTQFRGRLFEVLGAVEKRAADELRAKGDEPGATAAKTRSLVALKEAVAIQEQVIERALGGAPKR